VWTRVVKPALSETRHLDADRYTSRFENNCLTKMCSGSEAGSYLRLIDFVYHSTLGFRVITKKKEEEDSSIQNRTATWGSALDM